jgi:hypothetical protein
VSKKLQVTFDDGLPMGTCARFKHDGEIWIAYPARKNARIQAVMDRLLGIYGAMTENIVRCINNYPEDPAVLELATACLGSVDRARQLWWDLSVEKTRAVTS